LRKKVETKSAIFGSIDVGTLSMRRSGWRIHDRARTVMALIGSVDALATAVISLTCATSIRGAMFLSCTRRLTLSYSNDLSCVIS
jgi:hypothetical protein